MKTILRSIIMSATLAIVLAGSAFAGGIKFFKGSFEEALEESKRSNKPIFADFYADWCGPCKWMQRDVFTDKEVGDYFNENFISLKIDAERDEQDLVEFIELEAYPTLVFFDSDGDILLKTVGALDTDELMAKAKQATKGPEIRAGFKSDPDNYELLKDYLELVSAEDEDEAEKVALTYLRKLSKDELKSDKAWFLISEYVFDYETDIVKFVLENDEFFESEHYGYSDYILKNVMLKVLRDAIDNEDMALVQKCIDMEVRARKISEMLDHDPEYYALETKYIYFYNIDDHDNYFTSYEAFIKGYKWDDADELAEIVTEFADDFSYDPEMVKKSISWAHRAMELQKDWRTYFAASYAYAFSDEMEKAIELAEDAKKLTDDEDLIAELDDYIETLKS